MSQSYSSNCFSTANVIETDMQNVENNFDALRSLFSGSSAPTSPDAGQLWYDTGSSSVKIRYNSSWVEWWDMDGQCVAAGQVKTASLAAGVLSADATGRSKMADGYVVTAKIGDGQVTSAKIPDGEITPSKMAAGSSYLWQWSYDKRTDLNASETGEILSNVTNGTYKVWQRAYLYIPSGAKYVVLGVRASAQNYPANWRINVNGTVGSVAQPTYNAGINNAYGSPLDISSQAGAWRLCTIELSGAGGHPGVVAVAFTVTWYGA